MSNSFKSGCGGLLILTFQLIAWILSGLITWYFVDPNSCDRTLLFIITWTAIGTILHVVAIKTALAIIRKK